MQIFGDENGKIICKTGKRPRIESLEIDKGGIKNPRHGGTCTRRNIHNDITYNYIQKYSAMIRIHR